jgi:hypothetical protein
VISAVDVLAKADVGMPYEAQALHAAPGGPVCNCYHNEIKDDCELEV